MNDPMLSLKDVHTHIGAYHILHGVNLDVPRGKVTILLGRNGAGKSTTLRTIMGLWQASEGHIHLNGRPIGGMGIQLSTSSIAREGIAYVPEDAGIFSDLTVAENMILAARGSKTVDPQRLEWLFELFPAMKKFWHHPAGLLSGGQKQMLAVSRALAQPRKLLLFDEPSKGLAPAMVHNMISAFQRLRDSDATILLVEQNFNFARQLGDFAVVIEDGRTIYSAPMTELAADEQLQHRLLGLSADAHH